MRMITNLKASMILMCMMLGAFFSQARAQKELASGDFLTLSPFGYTADKEIALGNDSWLVSTSQYNSNVFYLGVNSKNTDKGLLSDKWADVIAAIKAQKDDFDATTTHAYAMRLQLAAPFENVGDVTINWGSANAVMQVYLFANTGSGLSKVGETTSSTDAGSVTANLGGATMSDLVLVALPAAANKTLRITTYEVMDNSTVKQVDTPVLSPNDGTGFVGSLTVTASCETEGAVLHYTTGEAVPTAASDVFPAEGLVIDATTTVNVIAVADGQEDSNVASATYNQLTAMTIGEVRALEPGTANVALKFDNVVVTYKDSKNLYIQDAEGQGICLYLSNINCTTGDVLSGYLVGTFTIYNGLYEMTGMDISAVTVTPGENEVTPVEVTLAELLANPDNYYLKVIRITEVTYDADKSTLVDGDKAVALYGTANLSDTFVWPPMVTVTGLVIPYRNAPEVIVRGDADIVNATNLVYPDMSWGVETFTYDMAQPAAQLPTFDTNSDGDVTFDTSNAAVATVDADGFITIEGVGTAVITATLSQTFSYMGATCDLTLVVLDRSKLPEPRALVSKTSAGEYYAMTIDNAGSYFGAEPVTVVNNKVVNAVNPDNISWYIADGNISNYNGMYVSHVSGKTSLVYSATSTGWTWTETETFSGWKSNLSTESDTRYIGFNKLDTGNRFGAYKNTVQQPFAVDMPFVSGQVISDVEADTYATICMHYDVAAADFTGAEFYSIAGKVMEGDKVTQLVLQPEEALQAGKPYICKYTAAQVVMVTAGDEVTTVSAQNGLVGVADVTVPPVGSYEVTASGVVDACSDNCEHAAGTAYINLDEVPEYSSAVEETTPVLTVNFVSSAQAAKVAAEVVDVYTLQGVLIRQAVKASAATAGLKAGVYVVGGQKVTVK